MCLNFLFKKKRLNLSRFQIKKPKTCPKTSLTDLQGIVLIDEMDAHLHPKYQLLRVAFYKKNIKKDYTLKKTYICV
jgi:predicted ATP-dependent endonuclease of OLD family